MEDQARLRSSLKSIIVGDVVASIDYLETAVIPLTKVQDTMDDVETAVISMTEGVVFFGQPTGRFSHKATGLKHLKHSTWLQEITCDYCDIYIYIYIYIFIYLYIYIMVIFPRTKIVRVLVYSI